MRSERLRGRCGELDEPHLPLGARAAAAVDELLDGTHPPEQWHSPCWGMGHLFVHRVAVRFFDAVLSAPKHAG